MWAASLLNERIQSRSGIWTPAQALHSLSPVVCLALSTSLWLQKLRYDMLFHQNPSFLLVFLLRSRPTEHFSTNSPRYANHLPRKPQPLFPNPPLPPRSTSAKTDRPGAPNPSSSFSSPSLTPFEVPGKLQPSLPLLKRAEQLYLASCNGPESPRLLTTGRSATLQTSRFAERRQPGILRWQSLPAVKGKKTMSLSCQDVSVDAWY